MSELTGWDRRLSVTADGKGLVGYAGAVLLRKVADRVGLTGGLAELLPAGAGHGWRERAHVVVQLAVAIVLGAMGLRNLPSKLWTVNASWMLAANLAADLDAWLRLLALHDEPDLADAEPDIMRFRLYHLPARLSRHARCRWLRIETTSPGPGPARSPRSGAGSTAPGYHLTAGPDPTKTRTEETSTIPGDVDPLCSRNDTRRPHPRSCGTNGRTNHLNEQRLPPTNRGQC